MFSAMRGDQCASMLEQTARWFDSTQGSFGCDLVEVSLQDGMMRAELALVTELDLPPDPVCYAFSEGELFCRYIKSPLGPNRRDASEPIRALAAVARAMPLRLKKAYGLLLDAPIINAPDLTLEYVGEQNAAEYQAFDAFLRKRDVGIKSTDSYPVLEGICSRDGQTDLYLIRLLRKQLFVA